MKSPQKQLRPALYFLGFLLFLALARDILANGRPLWCKINGQRYWPGLRTVWADEHKPYGIRILDSLEENQQWQRFRYEAAFFAPIPFSPGDYIRNPSVSFSKPGENHPGFPPGFRHWLGTDEQGRDVAAALVAGARVAVFTGALAMAIALGIGLLLGAVAGYFGDDRLRLPRGVIWLNMLGLPFASMYAYFIRADAISRHAAVPWGMEVIVFVLILLIFNVLYFALRWLPYLRKPVSVPADILIMRLAEVFNSIPRMILLIVVATLAPKQSLWVLIAVIGALSWTGVAKFVRSELLRVRELEYVTAARGLGYSEWRILLRHALPNALRPALIAFSFGVGGAIVLEASLTFLGFGGNSFRGVSWGSLLLSMKGHEKIWWVGLPAGLIIAFTVIALNTIGEQLNNVRR
ncbi:MAG TPA: ABC transporter permease [Saprospiraceae bacterium]|nr:ABC transporter permease [Saprospiraceae bacterium]